MPTEVKRSVGSRGVVSALTFHIKFCTLAMACVYILESEKDKRFYIGSTENLEKRLWRHNQGYEKATKPHIPYQLVFKQECLTIEEAKFLERKIKNWKRKDFILQVIRNGIVY